VNILDENIPEHQRQKLKDWCRVYQIGDDIGRKGIKDDEIITFLLIQQCGPKIKLAFFRVI
jgi:hypothetical protein